MVPITSDGSDVSNEETMSGNVRLMPMGNLAFHPDVTSRLCLAVRAVPITSSLGLSDVSEATCLTVSAH